MSGDLNADRGFWFDHMQEWLAHKDEFTYQGQLCLAMSILRDHGWTVRPPSAEQIRELAG